MEQGGGGPEEPGMGGFAGGVRVGRLGCQGAAPSEGHVRTAVLQPRMLLLPQGKLCATLLAAAATGAQGFPFGGGMGADIFEKIFQADPMFSQFFGRVAIQPIRISFMVRGCIHTTCLHTLPGTLWHATALARCHSTCGPQLTHAPPPCPLPPHPPLAGVGQGHVQARAAGPGRARGRAAGPH